MSRYVLVDETKRRGYVLAAVIVQSADADNARKSIRNLLLQGERRLHMKDERIQRKRHIASTIATMGVEATIYDAASRYRNEGERRGECLRALVADIARPDAVAWCWARSGEWQVRIRPAIEAVRKV